MAQRRMLSLKVIDTDNFIEMPQSSRLLYYEFSVRADDDGFLEAPKKTMKMVGCSEDDFKILCAKQYIIPFKTGVCVIKHWHIHNLIRTDRYTETQCKEEKTQIKLVNGKYEGCQNVIPDGNQTAPQVRIGKVRIGKVRIGKDKEDIFYDCDYFSITTVFVNEIKSIYKDKQINYEAEFLGMKKWLDDNPQRRKSRYSSFVLNWFKRASEKAKPIIKTDTRNHIDNAFITAKNRGMTIDELMELDPHYKEILSGIDLTGYREKYA